MASTNFVYLLTVVDLFIGHELNHEFISSNSSCVRRLRFL